MSASDRFFRRATGLVASAVLLLGMLLAPTRSAAASEVLSSPCLPTAEQLARYEADGTLDERIARAEALADDDLSSALIARALEREKGVSTLSSSVPDDWRGGMPTEGSARVIALYVDFPAGDGEGACTFGDGDTLEALDALIDGRGGSYPYEDLSSYYYRSSYGKLTITGDAYAYTARHPRSYYETIALDAADGLFGEVLAALDAEVDYADFDADGDGCIDGVYLHFAGPDDGWMSTWWSQVFTSANEGLAFDGVRVSKCALLHNASNTEAGAATIIHETGHVLGLPDYYNGSAQTVATWPTGIIGSDMMMDDVGDHNGFSKWLLGWLDEDDVTHVVATAGGIDVVRAGQTVASIGPDEDGTSSVTLDLGRFVSDDVTETGGIIVVSNGGTGIFSDYYVLQYDGFGGNQSLYTQEDASERSKLPEGFRMYRVRAGLNDSGSDFLHHNLTDRVGDQLIELVDPDMERAHLQGSGTTVCRAASGEYGCLLTEGDEVTPDTFPSTNFYEVAALGYTGIGVRVDACGSRGGTVTISHTGKAAPELPEFSVSLDAGELLYNAGTLHLTASAATVDTKRTSPMLLVGDERVPVRIEVERDRIEVSYRFDASLVEGVETCELLLPADTFVIGTAETGDVLTAPEIRVPIEVGPIAPVARTGAYSIERADGDEGLVSDAIALDDGSYAVFHATSEGVEAHLIAADGTESSHVQIEGLGPVGPDVTGFSATPLSEGRVALCFGSEAYSVAVVDMARCAGSYVYTGETYEMPEILETERGMIVVGTRLAALVDIDEDGRVLCTYGKVDEFAIAAAGEGYLVWEDVEEGGPDGQAVFTCRAAAASDVERALREQGSDGIDGAIAGESILECVDPAGVITFDTDGYRRLSAADELDGSFTLLMSYDPDAIDAADGYLLTFDGVGTQTGVREVTSSRDHEPGAMDYLFSAVDMGANGGVAVSRSASASGGFTEQEVVLYAPKAASGQSGSSAPVRLFVNGAMRGVWMADGAWLAVGWPVGFIETAAGAPPSAGDGMQTEEREQLGYIVTEPIDASSGVDPDPGDPGDDPEVPGTDDPDDPDGPDEPDEPAGPDEPVGPDEPGADDPAGPDEPGADDPGDVGEPDDPDVPGATGDPGDAQDASLGESGREGSSLPATGDAWAFGAVALALAGAVLCAAVLSRRRGIPADRRA